MHNDVIQLQWNSSRTKYAGYPPKLWGNAPRNCNNSLEYRRRSSYQCITQTLINHRFLSDVLKMKTFKPLWRIKNLMLHLMSCVSGSLPICCGIKDTRKREELYLPKSDGWLLHWQLITCSVCYQYQVQEETWLPMGASCICWCYLISIFVFIPHQCLIYLRDHHLLGVYSTR